MRHSITLSQSFSARKYLSYLLFVLHRYFCTVLVIELSSGRKLAGNHTAVLMLSMAFDGRSWISWIRAALRMD